MAIDVSVEQVGQISVVTPRGRLDGTTCNDLDTPLSAAIAMSPATVLDMAGLDYVSSAGLRILLKAAKQAKARKVKLVLCALHPNVREVFDISGFMTIFAITPDRATALTTAG